MLKQKHSLTKLRKELEERKEKLCFSCRKFRYLAQNYKNQKEREKRELVPQNKFEALASRVMRCEVELRRQETEESGWVFKYGKKEHKCREYLLWKRVKKGGAEKTAAHVAMSQKA